MNSIYHIYINDKCGYDIIISDLIFIFFLYLDLLTKYKNKSPSIVLEFIRYLFVIILLSQIIINSNIFLILP